MFDDARAPYYSICVQHEGDGGCIHSQQSIQRPSPGRVGFTDEPTDEVDVELWDAARFGGRPDTLDVLKAVRSTVALEDGVVEALDAQAKSCDAEIRQGLELGWADGAGLAFQGEFLKLRPIDERCEPLDKSAQLAR